MKNYEIKKFDETIIEHFKAIFEQANIKISKLKGNLKIKENELLNLSNSYDNQLKILSLELENAKQKIYELEGQLIDKDEEINVLRAKLAYIMVTLRG